MARKTKAQTQQDIQDEIDQMYGTQKAKWEALFQSLKNKGNPLLKEYEELLRKIKKETYDWDESLNDVFDSFKNIQMQLKDVNIEENKAARALNVFNDVSQDILAHEKKRKILSSEQLRDAKNLLKSKEEEIISAGKLKGEEDLVKDALNDQLEYLNKEIKAREQIERNIGLTGKMLEGMSKIPIVGGVLETDKALKAATAAAEDGAGALGTLGAAAASMGASLVSAFINPLAIIQMIIEAAKMFWNWLMEADKATAELARGMNISYDEASKLKTELSITAQNADKLSKGMETAYFNSRTFSESLLAINESLGISSRVSDDVLYTFTELREKAGYTNEELYSIYRFTAATGGNLKENVKLFAGTVSALNAQNKLTINEKTLLKDVSKVSDAIKLSVGGTAQAIATAAFKAKQFGINLEQADKISEGLLNFEESMTNEISAQLITGKNLNLEHARLLALNGDIAGASAEILQQLGGSAEFSNMNRIQQEAIAKAVGLSRDELAKSLIEREALQKIGVKDAEAAAQKYRELRRTMTMEEAIKELGDDAYAKQIAQNSVAEDFNAIIENIKDAFLPVAQELLPIIKEYLMKFKDHAKEFIEPLKNFILNTLPSMIEGFKKIMDFVLAIIPYIDKLMKVARVATGLATFGGSELAIYAMNKAEGKEYTGPFGIGNMLGLTGNDQPEVQAPQEATSDQLMKSALESNQSLAFYNPNNQSNQIASLLKEQQQTNTYMAALLNKDNNIYYDSERAGKSANQNSFKLQ